jgi:hypothetical protein
MTEAACSVWERAASHGFQKPGFEEPEFEERRFVEQD